MPSPTAIILLSNTCPKCGQKNPEWKPIKTRERYGEVILFVCRACEQAVFDKWWITPEMQQMPLKNEKGVIFFDVISDGRTNAQWIGSLYHGDIPRNKAKKKAYQLIKKSDFLPSKKIRYTIAVLRNCNYRTLASAQEEASRRGWKKIGLELIYLISEAFMKFERVFDDAYLWHVYTQLTFADQQAAVATGHHIHIPKADSLGGYMSHSGYAFLVSKEEFSAEKEVLSREQLELYSKKRPAEQALEEIFVYSAQGRYWAFTRKNLRWIFPLPSDMKFVFCVKQRKGEILKEVKARIKEEARSRNITHITNLFWF